MPLAQQRFVTDIKNRIFVHLPGRRRNNEVALVSLEYMHNCNHITRIDVRHLGNLTQLHHPSYQHSINRTITQAEEESTGNVFLGIARQNVPGLLKMTRKGLGDSSNTLIVVQGKGEFNVALVLARFRLEPCAHERMLHEGKLVGERPCFVDDLVHHCRLRSAAEEQQWLYDGILYLIACHPRHEKLTITDCLRKTCKCITIPDEIRAHRKHNVNRAFHLRSYFSSLQQQVDERCGLIPLLMDGPFSTISQSIDCTASETEDFLELVYEKKHWRILGQTCLRQSLQKTLRARLQICLSKDEIAEVWLC